MLNPSNRIVRRTLVAAGAAVAMAPVGATSAVAVPSAAAASGTPTTSGAERAARNGTTATRSTPARHEGGNRATRRTGGPKRVATSKRRADAGGRNRARTLAGVSLADALALAPAYTGPTGTVIHSRTVSVDLRAEHPSRTTSQRAESERWTEIGGGRREHYVGRTVDIASGRQLGRIEGWTTPTVSVVRSGVAAPIVGVQCVATPAPESDPLVRADRAALATLPAGPVIDGVATRVGVHTFGAASELRNYLDASTGRPLRSTHGTPGGEPQIQTTYLAWEERPAGGSAADLVPSIGADARLSPLTGPKGCIEQR